MRHPHWKASWIGRPQHWAGGPAQPTPLFRRAFVLNRPATSARLYITALGLYEAHLNGERVGSDLFTPGWTDYRVRVQYQAYDVAHLLREGDNVLAVELADGWYAGWIGFAGDREFYGSEPQLLAQLEIHDIHDSTSTFVTDDAWRAATGRRREADFLMGETVDARLEPVGWRNAGFDDRGWEPARLTDGTSASLVPPVAPPTRAIEERTPASIKASSTVPGAWIVDTGQNLVGWVRLSATGEAGTTITLRFAEMLEADGSLHVANLRSARATDVFTLAGTGAPEVFEPAFTFHGFRYVEVSGYPGELRPEAITAVVVHSDLPTTGFFRCSDDLVNQLQQNIVWGQRGNFLEVPTDCPQRDERLGWMGDAQIFAPTACFNMDVSAFLAKWMTDVMDAQSPQGGFPNVAPRVVDPNDGAPGWGDAGVIVPWVLYQRYGDRDLLAACFDAMAAWVDYIHRANPALLWEERRNGDMGDWLSAHADSPKDVVATSFFANSATIVASAARVLGRADDAERFDALSSAIRAAYLNEYVGEDGRIRGDTQTIYALALRFDLLPPDLRDKAAEHLVADIEAHDDHLTTGFLGVAHLLPALSETGHSDVAYRLLHQDAYPSWLYAVRHGATTIWERWDGWTDFAGFQNPYMNSFNHYAFGAVGEWLYEHVIGLRPLAEYPGFERFVVAPEPGGRLTWAEATYQSVRGEIRVRWDRIGDGFTLDLTVPAGTSAEVRLPDGAPREAAPGRHRFSWDA